VEEDIEKFGWGPKERAAIPMQRSATDEKNENTKKQKAISNDNNRATKRTRFEEGQKMTDKRSDHDIKQPILFGGEGKNYKKWINQSQHGNQTTAITAA
jgi:hypothetical protein